MNILVVGGTRFFGIPMVNKLLKDGHEVTIATRGNIIVEFCKPVNYVVLDRSDSDSAKSALGGNEYDVIIDKIAYSSNDVKALLENVTCKKYIQMSSCSVYKEDKENISESDFNSREYELVWMNRNDDYAEGKRQAERAALEFLDESQCIFVRYPIVMGPNDYTGRLKFYVDHVVEEKPMFIDNLHFAMPYIYEREAGEFIAHLVDKDIYGPINASSKGAISPQDIIEIIEMKIGKKALLSQDGDPAPYNGSLANISYDITKAINTGFNFLDIDEWIDDLLGYYL